VKSLKIFIKQDLPYINKGQYDIPFEIIDEKLATQLVIKGLAELLEGELQIEEKRTSQKHEKIVEEKPTAKTKKK
jgi:hypothetical protein